MDENELSDLLNRHFPDTTNKYPYCSQCRAQFDTVLEWCDHMVRVITKNTINWPAMHYTYGTWGYALDRAREIATKHRQKVWLYQGVIDGSLMWVVSWDPKKEKL